MSTDSRRLMELDRRVRNLELMDQQAFRTIPGGMAIMNPDTDEAIGQVGMQWDGTVAAVSFSSLRPPQPKPPSVATVATRTMLVSWSGEFVPDTSDFYETVVPAPMDFARVNIQVSQLATFPLGASGTAWRETFESARGGSRGVVFPSAGTWFVRLVATSVAGQDSVPSDAVSVAVS